MRVTGHAPVLAMRCLERLHMTNGFMTVAEAGRFARQWLLHARCAAVAQ